MMSNSDFKRHNDDNFRGRSAYGSRSRSPRRRDRSRDRSPSRRVYDDYVSRDYEDDDRYGRGRYRDDRYSRSYDDFRDRDRKYGDDRMKRRDKRDGGPNEPLLPPSSTIILQNIGPNISENMIEDRLRSDNVLARHIAVIRDRNTGDNRGYAFVEFDRIDPAESWLMSNNRVVYIDNRPIYLNFSKSRKFEPQMFPDWYCTECKALNFGSRKQIDRNAGCFRCGLPQKENAAEQNLDHRGKDSKDDSAKLEPCNVLMLRGMDFSSTEETIRRCITELTVLPIYDVRLIKDKVTEMSRGFAFVEMGATEDAKVLLETIESRDPPFEIENRRVIVGYARHGYNAPLNKNNGRSSTAASIAVAQGANSTAEYGQVYARPSATSDRAAARDHQPAQSAAFTVNHSYDPTTGFYYDSSTELYYDPKSGYYYNGNTGQYLYWNGTRYQAVQQDGTPVPPTTVATTTPTVTKGKEKVVGIGGKKPKEARKIAKDMERWAKKVNTATQAKKEAVQMAQQELKMLEEKEEELRRRIIHEKAVLSLQANSLNAGDGVRSLFVSDFEDNAPVLGAPFDVAAISAKPGSKVSVADLPDEDEEEETIESSSHVDAVKLTCLLCKRQFADRDVLTKHLQMSQLHKQNLVLLRKGK